MNVEIKEQMYEGKAKQVFATSDPEIVMVHYKDDATAGDGEKKGTIRDKGIVNNKLSNALMQKLEKEGIPTHYVEELNDRDTLVKKVQIVPLEVIIRNVAAGHFSLRMGVPEGKVFKTPILEYSYKNDDLHDPFINHYYALALDLATQEELDTIAKYAFKVNEVLKKIMLDANIRLVDFKREKDGVPAVVKSIEYDPNRSARIALLFYADGEKRYIIAPNGLQVGATLLSGAEAAPEVGNALPLSRIPVGTVIHNIELRPGEGARLVRSAGNFAQLTSRDGAYCVIKLPSGETRQILSACKATVGSVGNSDHALEQSGKAGRSRWLGRRPHNRGVVMNPVDHPMGGGEGRQSGGHPRSRKGLYAKGLKTRAPKKLSNKYIIERANKK